MTARTPDTSRTALRTACGRDVSVAVIALGDAACPVRRVTVNVGECDGCHDGAWAALTPAEARRLAAALIAQASVAERGQAPDSGGRIFCKDPRPAGGRRTHSTRLFSLLAVGPGLARPGAGFKGRPKVNPQQAIQMQDGGAILLDVREDAEWRAGHAPGARHIPLGRLPQRMKDLPARRVVITVCRSGLGPRGPRRCWPAKAGRCST